jgi:hypothetical protein
MLVQLFDDCNNKVWDSFHIKRTSPSVFGMTPNLQETHSGVGKCLVLGILIITFNHPLGMNYPQ